MTMAPQLDNRVLYPFPEGWYMIATRREVERAGVVGKMWMGIKVVVWCDSARNICVAQSVCPHLGSDLGPDAGGRVVGGRLVCPFHGFEFDPTGQCVGTPGGAPARSARLTTFETCEIEGLLFAWWGLDGRPPQFELPAPPPLEGRWASAQIRTVRFAGHPQETSENSVDIAHLSYVHGYGNVVNDDPVIVDGPSIKSRFGFTTRRRIAKFGRLTMAVEATAEVVGLGCSFVDFCELTIGMDLRLWVFATPVDAELLDLTIVSWVRELRSPKRPIAGLSFLPVRWRAPLINKFVADLQMHDVHQDVVIWSRKRNVAAPRLNRNDGEIMKYREFCKQFYPEQNPYFRPYTDPSPIDLPGAAK